MAQGVLDGFAEFGFRQDVQLDVLKPCEISLELLFFKLETLFFTLFFREPCKPFVDGLPHVCIAASQIDMFRREFSD